MKRIGLALAYICLGGAACADDKLLDDAVAFTGQIFHIDSAVPGLIIAGVRGDESAIYGFGETAVGNGKTPGADTRIAIASITKTFTGLLLATLAADGTVALTEPAGPHLGAHGIAGLPERDGHQIRFLDLATHSSGLPRELAELDGVTKYSDASFAKNLEGDPFLFAPGTGISYSNVGMDVLGMALSGAADAPYSALMTAKVLAPLGLTATGYEFARGDNAFTGYDWNREPMEPETPIPNRFGASSLTTTAQDMVQYLKWNLDRFSAEGAEARTLSHAAYLIRDGLEPVFGMDESGHMDAMGLGWVIMMPEGTRPLIIQKAGGTNGTFSYIAFAPNRGVGVFIAINQFNFSAGMEMATVVNDLIGALAPR